MPASAPIDPTGCYHIGTRGNYGQPMFRTPEEHELFLRLFQRAADKYGWATLTWALVWNHHHFVIQLTRGGLSEGLQQLHCGYSRRIHVIDGHTGQGHLIRHRFFQRGLATDEDVLIACRYVDLNIPRATGCRPEEAQWSGYRALVGLEHPRLFHRPSELLARLSSSPATARRAWAAFVREGLVQDGPDPSSNDGV
jgi:REP element-mobilizing transposase RayT